MSLRVCRAGRRPASIIRQYEGVMSIAFANSATPQPRSAILDARNFSFMRARLYPKLQSFNRKLKRIG